MPEVEVERIACRLQLDRESVTRLVISLLREELGRVRAGALPQDGGWNDRTNLYEAPLRVTEEERVLLGKAVGELFHLPQSTIQDLLRNSGKIIWWVEDVLAAVARCSAKMSFRSGGQSALHTHDWQLLEQEVPAWASLLHGRRRIVSFVPCHELYGFLHTVLLPKYMQVPVVDARSAERVQLLEGDLLIGEPEALERLAAGNERIPGDVIAVSSTAPMPHSTASALRAKGLASLVEVYGNGQTGGIAFRFQNGDPFTLLPYFRADENGDLLRVHPSGDVRKVWLDDVVRWDAPNAFYVVRPR